MARKKSDADLEKILFPETEEEKVEEKAAPKKRSAKKDAVEVVENPQPEVAVEIKEDPVEVKPEIPEKSAEKEKSEPEKVQEAEEISAPVAPTTKKESPKKGIKLGEMKVFSARVYASSVAKQVYFLAVGKVFVIDTEEHDGRVRVALDELNSKVGWADIEELTR